MASHPIHRRARPRLETLEDRLAPATFLVSNANDAGAGSLRAAILAANNTIAADTIVFSAGMAGKTITLTSGEIVITKALTIAGLGAGRLGVSGNDASRIFDITDGTAAALAVRISGLTLKDGSASDGGALRNTENLVLAACRFEGNVASSSGGAIRHDTGALTVSGSTFASNLSTGVTGAGAINSQSDTTLVNCVFTGNTGLSGSGGAIRLADLGTARTLVVRSSQFVGNQAGARGGGLVCFGTSAGTTLTLTGSTIRGNAAAEGAGAAFSGNAAVSVVNSTFRANIASGSTIGHGRGGALLAESGSLAVRGSTFDANQARGAAGQNGQGPGASAGGGGAAAAGGAIASTGVLVVADSTFTNNAAIGGNGGNASAVAAGVFVGAGGRGGGPGGGAGGASGNNGGIGSGQGGGGGGGSAFASGNSGGTGGNEGGGGGGGGARTDGGGLGGSGGGSSAFGGFGGRGASSLAGGGGGGSGRGGAIAVLNGSFAASGSTFVHNLALGGQGGKNSAGGGTTIDDGLGMNGLGLGGAVFVKSGGASTDTLASSTLTANTADLGGGLYQFDGHLTLADALLDGNTAWRDGGGLVAAGDSLALVRTTIAGNTSGVKGGGVHTLTTLRMTGSTVSGNRAGDGGGGLYVSVGTTTLVAATIVGNQADPDSFGTAGGGIYTDSLAITLLHSSIVAGNRSGIGGSSADEIEGSVSSSSRHNLLGDPATAGGLVHGSAGNILGQAGSGGTRVLLTLDEILDPVLRNTGGHTPTHALADGSPALNAGESNLAPLGTATQSSTLGSNPAAEAIDRLFDSTSFSHTDTTDTNATWTLTLPADAAIGLVTLHNRVALQGRLRDITVSILDAADNVLASSGLLNPENVLGGPATLTFDAGGVTGRKIRVQRTPDPDLSGGGSGDADRNCLALAEVTVREATDQRGLPRQAGIGVDIGAVEQPGALFSDGFTRANSATLGLPWARQAGAPGVQGNLAQGVGAATTVHLATVTGLVVADVDLRVVTSIGPGQQVGLVARHSGAGDRNLYLGTLARAADGTFSARILRRVNGIASELAVAENLSASTGSQLRFVVAGSMLRLFLDGILVTDAEDLTLRTGAVGLRTVGGAQLDNFEALPLFAGTAVLDSFAGADGTHPASHWARVAGSYRIDAGQARGLEANNLAVLNGATAGDVDVRAAVKAAGLGHRAGVVVRHNGPGDRNYYLGQVVRTPAGFTATLVRNVNGVPVVLATANVASATGQADLRLVATGATLRFLVNGTQVADLFDGTFARGGVGIRSDALSQFDLFDARPVGVSLAYSDDFADGAGVEWTRRAGNVVGTAGKLGGTAAGPAANLATVSGIVAPHVEVQAALALTATGQQAGLVACYNGPGDANYYLGNVTKTATGFILALLRRSGPTFAVLKTASVASLAGAVALRVQGNRLTMLVNGVEQLSATDSTFTTGGVGVRLVGGATADGFVVTPLPFTSFRDAFPTGVLNPAWAPRAGGYTASGNLAKGTAALNLMTLARFAAADLDVQAAVSVPGTAGQFAAVVARQSAGDLNHYQAAITRVGTQFVASLSRRVNGVTTTLASAAVGGGTGTLRLLVVGGKLSLSFNGTEVLTATDFSLTSGSVGIRSSLASELDNFRAELALT